MAKHSSDADSAAATPLDEQTGSAETIRSEERLRVGTERVPTRVARVQKVIVTEQRTITVDVRHEEVRVVYEDLPAGAAASAATDAPRTLPELVLHEERIEVRTTTVPVERVRPVIETVHGQQEVTGSVRVERVEVERTTPIDPTDAVR